MFPAVSMICGIAARACLPMCLHMSSSDLNFSCLLHWSLWITTLNRSLPWSPYMQCACSVELYRSLLWSPILLIQHPDLPTPHMRWFMVGIWAGKFLYWSSFSVTGQVGGRLRCWFPLTGLPWNPPAVHGLCIGPLPAFAWTKSQAYQLVMSLNYMKQINSMLRCICSVTDHSRCQNMVRTPAKPLLPWYGSFLFLPHFNTICDLLLNSRTATWNLFI